MKTLVLAGQDIYKGNLILVNKDYPIRLNCEHIESRLIPFDSEYQDILLETKTSALLAHLINTVDAQSMIIPISGYRSYEEQMRIYNDSLIGNGREFTSKYVALPNSSEHQTGLAVDLSENVEEIDFICPSFPYTGVCNEFRKKASAYGFIERYGKNKEDVTGISHEPWHFRFIGYPHSQIIEDNGFSLEEYIDHIKGFPYKGDHLILNTKGKCFEIFYVEVKSNETIIDFNDNVLFQVSGNNIDGYIITIWK